MSDTRHATTGKHRGRAFVAWGTPVAALVAIALSVAACGSAPSSLGVASIKGSPSSTAIPGGIAGNSGGPPTPHQLLEMTKYAECARKHGFSNFPDPTKTGFLNISESVEEQPGYASAATKCGAPPSAPASYFANQRSGGVGR